VPARRYWRPWLQRLGSCGRQRSTTWFEGHHAQRDPPTSPHSPAQRTGGAWGGLPPHISSAYLRDGQAFDDDFGVVGAGGVFDEFAADGDGSSGALFGAEVAEHEVAGAFGQAFSGLGFEGEAEVEGPGELVGVLGRDQPAGGVDEDGFAECADVGDDVRFAHGSGLDQGGGVEVGGVDSGRGDGEGPHEL
jgi:hypothetical protein